LLQKYRRKAFPQAGNAGSEAAEQKPKRVLDAIPENPIHGAFREILEVLVAEPGYIPMVSETFSPADFEPEVCREIADKLWKCSEKLGEFSLSELLGTVEEPDLADIITHLYKEGSRKGNFAKTLEEAMRCIEQCRYENSAMQTAVKIDGKQSDEEADRQLQLLAEQLSKTVRRVPGALVE